MKPFVFGLIVFLLVGLVTGCSGVLAPAPTSTEVELQAPELDLSAELQALEPILPDLGEIDVVSLELPPDLLGAIEIEVDVSLSPDLFDLSLPSPESLSQ